MCKIKTNDVTVKLRILSLMLNSITSDSVLIVEGEACAEFKMKGCEHDGVI